MSRSFTNVYKALEGQIIVETGKAILFVPTDKETGKVGKQEWFPKSQLASFGGTYDEIEGTFQFILATEWILGQKGLLSIAVDKSQLPSAQVIPIKPASFSGVTKKDKAARLPYKDDEGNDEESADDYWARMQQADGEE